MRLKEYLPQLGVCLGLAFLILGVLIDSVLIQNIFGLLGFSLFSLSAALHLRKSL